MPDAHLCPLVPPLHLGLKDTWPLLLTLLPLGPSSSASPSLPPAGAGLPHTWHFLPLPSLTCPPRNHRALRDGLRVSSPPHFGATVSKQGDGHPQDCAGGTWTSPGGHNCPGKSLTQGGAAGRTRPGPRDSGPATASLRGQLWP